MKKENDATENENHKERTKKIVVRWTPVFETFGRRKKNGIQIR